MDELNGNFNKEGHKEAFVSSGVHTLNKKLKNGTLFYFDRVPEQYCIPERAE